jgi:putative endonuclease
MFYVYILKSKKSDRFYIGQTNDIQKRLVRHNAGRVPSTKHGVPWCVILYESYDLRSEAMIREKEIKKFKGGILFKKLIGEWKE